MKKLLLSLVALLCASASLYADAYKTLTFPDENSANNSISAYNKSWTATIGDQNWIIDCFNNNSWKSWTYIRTGSKSYELVSSIATQIDKPLQSITATIDKITASSVNSIFLIVATDSACNNILETINASALQAGDMTFNISKATTNNYYKLMFDCKQGSANGFIQVSKVEYFAANGSSSDPDYIAAPTIMPATGTYYEAQTVTMTAGEGCTIKYSINQGAEQTYSEPFQLSEAGTYSIAAYATNAEGKNSETAASVITIATLPEYNSIKEAFSEATSTAAPCKFTFNNYVVTAASSSNAFLQDADGNVAVIYQSGHGFTQGQTISGTISTNIQLYNGILEFRGITSTTEGLTLGTGTPIADEMSLEDLGPAHYGKLNTIKNATYSDGKFSQTTDDTYYVTPYKTFMTLPDFIEGKNYNITGIALYYTNKTTQETTLEIAPRSEEDIVLLTDQKAQTLAADYKTALQAGEEDIYTINQEGDGAITATSSDGKIATVSVEGNNVTVKAIAKGTATITLNAAETSTYLPTELSYTITVSNAGEYEATWVASEHNYLNAQSLDSIDIKANEIISIIFSQGTNKTNNPKYYTTGTAARLYANNTLTIAAAESYAIKSIDFKFSAPSYIGKYTADAGTYTTDSLAAIGLWVEGATASSNSVQFTATNTNRLQSITITYVKDSSAKINGDVNGDGNVDIADVNAVIAAICGTATSKDNADVNNDNAVDIADVNAVIGIICNAK